MIVRVLPEATREAWDAAAYLEQRSDGLGDDFLSSLQRAFEEIGEHPLMFPRVLSISTRREFRSVMLDRFPYEVVYLVRPDFVQVVAVAHAKRRPGYWRRRSS